MDRFVKWFSWNSGHPMLSGVTCGVITGVLICALFYVARMF